MDKDRDSRLGNNDFAESVREDPLLLSCFGQIFPSSRVSIIQKKKYKWQIDSFSFIQRKADFEQTLQQMNLGQAFTEYQLEAFFDY